MHKVLLIWEQVPENTRVFELELADEEFTRAKKCHGCYVNTDSGEKVQKELDWLSVFLEGKVPRYDSTSDDTKEPFNLEEGVTVIVTGFVM